MAISNRNRPELFAHQKFIICITSSGMECIHEKIPEEKVRAWVFFFFKGDLSSRWWFLRACSGNPWWGGAEINGSFFAGSAFYSSFYSHGSEHKFCHWLSCDHDEVPDIRENCYTFSVMKPASFHFKGLYKEEVCKSEQKVGSDALWNPHLDKS